MNSAHWIVLLVQNPAFAKYDSPQLSGNGASGCSTRLAALLGLCHS